MALFLHGLVGIEIGLLEEIRVAFFRVLHVIKLNDTITEYIFKFADSNARED